MGTFFKSPVVVAAVVSAITSLVTVLLTILTKNSIEKRLLIFKLDMEHKFEQRKQIKNVLATNKSRLLEACENLNHRLWNFSKPEHFGWLQVKGDYNKDHYYFHSFAYRILAVYGWIHKIQTELIHLDATIATRDDIEFIKFMRFYGRIFSDTDFFKGYQYDYRIQEDHIFKNNLDELYNYVTTETGIISFNEYLEKTSSYGENPPLLYRILDGVNLSEKRLRWQWFQILKLLNLAFLNSYGYDYQKTSNNKMQTAIMQPQKSILHKNFIFLLKEHKLEKQKEIEKLIKLLEKNL